MIGIVNYGVGNLASVKNAFDRLDAEAAIIDATSGLDACERVILPGVGSFRRAMETLNQMGWSDALRSYAASGRPLLGICLGMQLLLDEGEEHGTTKGLGLIPGRVTRLTPQAPNKVPHVGWNSLKPRKSSALLGNLKTEIDYYFVHSYHCVPANDSDTLATCDFGGEFVAAVESRNVAGMQFHPEKSQPSGLRLLDNFTRWSP
jgi:glutamine amidotransferase